jgi:hypothetical protein
MYSENNWSLCLKSIISSLLGTHIFGGGVDLAWSRNHWLLPCVIDVCFDLVSSTNEIGSDHLNSLSLIQSNFYSAITFAVAQEVVVLDVGGDHVLHVGHHLYCCVVAILGEASKVDINHLSVICWLVIEPSGIVSEEV